MPSRNEERIPVSPAVALRSGVTRDTHPLKEFRPSAASPSIDVLLLPFGMHRERNAGIVPFITTESRSVMKPAHWLSAAAMCVPFAAITLVLYPAPGCAEGNAPDSGKFSFRDAADSQEKDPAPSVDTDASKPPSRDGGGVGPPMYEAPFNSDATAEDSRDSSTPGTPPAGVDSGSCVASVEFAFTGPASPGIIKVKAWWQPPGTGPRVWSDITECADLIPDDGKLGCSFSVPCDTAPLEFQVYLPDGRFWGDTSFDPKGGKGSTIGAVSLTSSKGPLVVTLVPNPSGAPYYNGRVESIP